jgi:methyl-accepting chemotaxis protein
MNSKEQASYLDQLRERGDRLLLIVTWALGAISLGMSFWYQTLGAFLWIGLPTLAAVSAQVKFNGGTLYSRLSIAAGFMVMTGLMIHQAHGMLEIHFFVFVLLAFLLYYRDWVAVVAGAAVIAVHHLLFDQLQRHGGDVFVFAQDTGLHIVIIHALFVVAESLVLCVMAIQLKREVDAIGASPSKLADLSGRVAQGERVSKAEFAGAPAGSVAAAMADMSQVLTSVLNDVHEVVSAQAAGNFSRRVAVENRRGVVGEVAVAINQACAQLEKAMAETTEVLDQVANGNLSQRIRFEADGEFLRLKNQTNRTVDFLEAFCRNQQLMIEAACAGDLGRRLELDGLAGYQRQLATGLNNLLGAFDLTLKAVSEVMVQLSEGRLDGGLRLETHTGRFGELAHHTTSSISKLSDLIAEVQSEAEQIKTAASEIALASNDLNSRTEDQSAKLQRTASSAVQISATVKQNEGNSHEANRCASSASQVAASGSQVVGQMVGTMHEINRSSSRIADIIGVIDGIAFQTNILALNAAVEAARAGEQGRGFAVVASEVRMLAQRSATAAKEIKQLITESVEKVAQGTEYVEQAGQTMQDIVGHIAKLAGLMSEITAASTEQATGVDAISTDIAQMEEITQQNAAMVEEAAATARAMDESATNLTDMVCRFTLGGTNASSTAKVLATQLAYRAGQRAAA